MKISSLNDSHDRKHNATDFNINNFNLKRRNISVSKRTGIGILIILIGLGFLLQQADIFPFTNFITDWWPAIFIIIGAVQLLYHTQTSIFTGPFFILIGGLLLVNQWSNLSLINYIWPLIIIYIGIVFIFNQTKHHKEIDENHMLRSFSLFSGSEIKSRSHSLKGGTVTTIFGGAEIDLRDAVINEKEIIIELISLFGGVELRVPQDVKVDVRGIPIFGGWEDSTRPTTLDNESAPTIIIKCVVIFGGAEITN